MSSVDNLQFDNDFFSLSFSASKTPFQLSFISDQFTVLNAARMGFQLQWREVTAC
jgi:hypothetical protein